MAAGVALIVAAAAGISAVVAMSTSLLLLGAYDLWGKRAAFPPATDLVQGIGWAALAWFGATVPGDPSHLTVWLGVFVTIAILLVNGVLGAARDLANDADHGARTTTIFLGATVRPDGTIDVPRRVLLYADALHVLQVAVLVVGMTTTDSNTAQIVAVVAIPGVGGWLLLRAILRGIDDPRFALRAGFGYLVVMLLAPCLLVADGIDASLGLAIVLLFAVPWLGSRWLRTNVRDLFGRRRRPHLSS